MTMLTRNRQIQALADFIDGRPVNIAMAQMDPLFAWLYKALAEVSPAERYQELTSIKMQNDDDGEVLRVIEAIRDTQPGFTPEYQSLDEIAPELPEVEWLWEGWVPRGLLTLLAAWGGVGKSYLMLDIARRLIDGLKAPDGQDFEVRNPSVIYVDAEDFLPVLYQRVRRWGMDCTKFFPLQKPPRDLIDLSSGEYQDQLVDMCYDLRPDLVIVDSLSRVNRRGENSIEEMRDVLDFLAQLPKAFDCSLILIHHLRKRSSAQATLPVTVHDIRGTGDLIAASRSVLGMDVLQADQNGDPNGPRRLKMMKTNLIAYPKPLAIHFNPLRDDPAYVSLSYEVIPHQLQIKEPTAKDETARWLLEVLSEGPVSYTDLKDYLEDELGYSETTLQEARNELGAKVTDTVGSKRPGNMWMLTAHLDKPSTEEKTLTENAAQWLLQVLADGPRTYGELKAQLQEDLGLSESILQRARRFLGDRVGDSLGKRRNGNKWMLK